MAFCTIRSVIAIVLSRTSAGLRPVEAKAMSKQDEGLFPPKSAGSSVLDNPGAEAG